MANHQYELSALNSADLTKATLQARREIHQTVGAMRRMPGDWKHARLVSTAARDCDNLLMAGRCISGAFDAHSSCRVTGNAVATGEAAGIAATLAALRGILPAQVPFLDVCNQLEVLRNREVEIRSPE